MCIVLVLLRIIAATLYLPGAASQNFIWHNNKTHTPGDLKKINIAQQAPTKHYNKDRQHSCLNRSQYIDLKVISTLLNLNHRSQCFSTLNTSPSQLSHRSTTHPIYTPSPHLHQWTQKQEQTTINPKKQLERPNYKKKMIHPCLHPKIKPNKPHPPKSSTT